MSMIRNLFTVALILVVATATSSAATWHVGGLELPTTNTGQAQGLRLRSGSHRAKGKAAS